VLSALEYIPHMNGATLMAFARFSATSDVYVFASSRGIECCGCPLDTSGQAAPPVFFTDFETLAAHLREHQGAGHKVPPELLDPGLYIPADFTGGPYYPNLGA
jgi:hypothetical protein